MVPYQLHFCIYWLIDSKTTCSMGLKILGRHTYFFFNYLFFLEKNIILRILKGMFWLVTDITCLKEACNMENLVKLLF